MPILKTRLYKPVLKAQYVIRENVFEYLDFRADNSLILFVAPAGYGKSVTVSQWIDRRKSKFGWISIDSDCNELSVFLDYLVSSIQLSYPLLLVNIKEFCNRMDLPSAKVISNLFINEVAKLEEDFILVLDDYHLINSQPVHDLLNELLKYLPEKFKLVILSRRDPPLILSSMKAYDQVNEIRMSELKFDANEVIELSKNTLSKEIKFETVSELVKLTEGWITGLKMAIHSIEHGHDHKYFLSGLGREMHAITHFLTDEILQPFTPYIRECFYKASILPRFCRDMLSDVCQTEGNKGIPSNVTGSVIFNEITNQTLFVIPLDSDQIWFRFHHLFGEILHKQLEKNYNNDQISDLHRKASRWFERNGFFDEALSHAITANDLEFANQILENQFKDLFNNERLSVMDRWLKMFPPEAMNKYLSLNLIHAFSCDFHHDLSGMEKALKTSYEILIKQSPEKNKNNTRWGYYFTLKSTLLYKTGRIEESLLASKQALEILHTDNCLLRDDALLYHVFASIATGNLTEAENKTMEFRGLIHPGYQLGMTRNSLIVSFISFFSGNLPRIYSSLYPVISYYKRNSFKITGNMAFCYLGFVNYQWNRLDEANELFDYIWEHRFAGAPRWVLQSIFLQILTYQAKGDKNGVNELFDEAHQYVNEFDSPVYEQLLACMEVEIAVNKNNFNRVEQYRYTADFDQYSPYCYYFVPQLTRVKLKISESGNQNFPDAQKELSEIIEYLKNTHNTTLLIQALTLQAVILKLQDKITEALKYLSGAITLAKYAGFIRVFVDGGKAISDLLILLKNDNKEDIYLDKILEAFPLKSPGYKNDIQNYPSILKKHHLTHQEVEILKLLSEGLQNKQIAAKLFLSPNSIKKYLYDIFKKLEVNKRSNAVEKAKQINII